MLNKNNKFGSDLLSQGLGQKPQPTEGSGNPEPHKSATTSTPVNVSKGTSVPEVKVTRGDNLLDQAREGGSSTTAIAGDTSVDGGESTSASKDDSAGSTTADWSLDNALKEIKKLREENKARRLKYEETVDKIKNDYDTRVSAIEAQLQEKASAQKELDKIKADQEDKKRDLAERVAHREARIAELEAEQTRNRQETEKRELALKVELEKFQAEKQAEEKVYQQKVDSELAEIPEKYRETAKLIVKGAGDYREALYELQAAKANKLFEEKTVQVVHATPGAKDGARATKDQLDEAAKAVKAKMSSSQKIRAALKEIRNGNDNPAFKL